MLKIQSISDIITNSSSEVFLIESDSIRDFINEGKWYPIVFDNLDSIRKYLESDETTEGLDSIIDWNPYSSDDYYFNGLMEKLKEIHTSDEIWNFFAPIYKTLLGKTLYILDNNYTDDFLTDIRISEAKTNKKAKIVSHETY